MSLKPKYVRPSDVEISMHLFRLMRVQKSSKRVLHALYEDFPEIPKDELRDIVIRFAARLIKEKS